MLAAARQKLASCHIEIAMLYREVGESKEAIREIEAAMRITPGLAVHYYYLADFHEKDRNTEARKNALVKALEIDTANPTGRYQLAETLVQGGDWNGAIRELELCIKYLDRSSKASSTTEYYYDPQGSAYSIVGLRAKAQESIRETKLKMGSAPVK
jgi:predicted Zn-dependent protease